MLAGYMYNLQRLSDAAFGDLHIDTVTRPCFKYSLHIHKAFNALIEDNGQQGRFCDRPKPGEIAPRQGLLKEFHGISFLVYVVHQAKKGADAKSLITVKSK